MENKIVSPKEWLRARRELLEEEKDFTRRRDALNRRIRQLPWMKVEKNYSFRTIEGVQTLVDLFEGRSQLIIYHFMFGPDWKEGCKSCSFWADNFDNIIIHLNQRDVTMLAVSRGPFEKLQAFKKRMNWSFKWVSSLDSDFNFDFQVSFREGEKGRYNYREVPPGKERELPGISVFYKDEEGTVFHTYSAYARGLDRFNTAYHYLDIVPKGRDEEELSYGMAWVRLHDQY